ncbi:MAG: hypothetical protein V3R45_00790 [Candidatus Aminicenantaceae bacterium]
MSFYIILESDGTLKGILRTLTTRLEIMLRFLEVRRILLHLRRRPSHHTLMRLRWTGMPPDHTPLMSPIMDFSIMPG